MAQGKLRRSFALWFATASAAAERAAATAQRDEALQVKLGRSWGVLRVGWTMARCHDAGL